MKNIINGMLGKPLKLYSILKMKLLFRRKKINDLIKKYSEFISFPIELLFKKAKYKKENDEKKRRKKKIKLKLSLLKIKKIDMLKNRKT